MGRWVASSWLVPDLTLVSLVLAMVWGAGDAVRRGTHGRPRNASQLLDGPIPSSPSIAPALLAGCCVALSAGRHGLVIAWLHVAVGAAVKWISTWWDLTDPSMQLTTVGVAEVVLLVAGFVLDATLSIGLLSLAGLKVAITMACLLFLQRRMGMSSSP